MKLSLTEIIHKIYEINTSYLPKNMQNHIVEPWTPHHLPVMAVQHHLPSVSQIHMPSTFHTCFTYLDRTQSGFLGRLPKVDLITLEGEKCPSVRPSVRPSVHKKFLRFQRNLVYRIGSKVKVKVTSP